MADKKQSLNMYRIISSTYDLMDKVFFGDGDSNPRNVLSDMIADEKCRVLDLCCGTAANGLSVAVNRPQAAVIGVDRSKPMLRKARQKAADLHIDNIKLLCRDASSTGLPDGSFDYITIGLVLHECDPAVCEAILSEAYRLLKKNGRLIVLDWDRPLSLGEKLIFSPLYVTESIGTPKYFKDYYDSDKEAFFAEYGFEAEENISCKYTFVMKLKKGPVKKAKDPYLARTHMLDYDHYMIRKLISGRGWSRLREFERIKAIYDYVRDEILFGYNVDDGIQASRVLKDGYGQCNTKGTLFMALLRAVGIPCRIHGFTIRKELQKGAMTGFVYRHAPENIFHSWVEVLCEGHWYELEAFIIDSKYLKNLQRKYRECTGDFCGFGVCVTDLQHPIIDFNRNNTYIQSEGINRDFGIYESPDQLLAEHHQDLGVIQKTAFRCLGRHLMNLNVSKLRG